MFLFWWLVRRVSYFLPFFLCCFSIEKDQIEKLGNGQPILLYPSWPIKSCYQGKIWEVWWSSWARMPLFTLVYWKPACRPSYTPFTAARCALWDQDKGLFLVKLSIKIPSKHAYSSWLTWSHQRRFFSPNNSTIWKSSLSFVFDWKLFLQDNVFINVVASVEYRALAGKANEAFYKLTNPKTQIQAYVFDGMRKNLLYLPCCQMVPRNWTSIFFFLFVILKWSGQAFQSWIWMMLLSKRMILLKQLKMSLKR